MRQEWNRPSRHGLDTLLFGVLKGAFSGGCGKSEGAAWSFRSLMELPAECAAVAMLYPSCVTTVEVAGQEFASSSDSRGQPLRGEGHHADRTQDVARRALPAPSRFHAAVHEFVNRLCSVIPRFVVGPVPDPSREAGFSGGVTELSPEGDGTDVTDEPDVPSMGSGDDEVPVHRTSVGAEHDGALAVDLFKEIVGIVVRCLVLFPLPRPGQWKRLPQVTVLLVIAPVVRKLRHGQEPLRRRPGRRTVRYLSDEGPVGLG